MTDPELTTDPRVETALLRDALSMTAQALKTYHDAPHFELDDEGERKWELIVPETAREQSATALARAQELLQKPEK